MTVHEPVLVSEILTYLQPRPGAVIADVTVGTAGHSLTIAPQLLPSGHLIGMDQDPDALAIARQRLAEFTSGVTLLAGNFSDLPALLASAGHQQVDGILADLGMSSLQVNMAQRGFSFMQDGPLDMRMDPAQALTAAAFLRRTSLGELTRVFAEFGEERYAGRIARRIVEARRRAPLETTTELAQLIAAAVPVRARHGRLHPATRVFQALRIAVNDELAALDALLQALPAIVRPGGRAVMLSYHSLEDRRVKQAFAAGAREGLWRLLTKKPVTPSDDEVARNPRARSAKLRAVERGAA